MIIKCESYEQAQILFAHIQHMFPKTPVANTGYEDHSIFVDFVTCSDEKLDNEIAKHFSKQ